MATTIINPNPTGARNENNPAWDARKRNYIYWIVGILAALAVAAILVTTMGNPEVAAPTAAPARVNEPTLPQNAAPGTSIEQRTDSTTTTTRRNGK